MSKNLHVAVGSTMSIPGDIVGNLQQIRNFARKAAADGVDFLLTPELSATGYGPYPEVLVTAEPAGDGEIFSTLVGIAAETEVVISAGFVEAAAGKRYLAQYVVYPDASFVIQRKHRVTKNEQPLDTFVDLVYRDDKDEIGQPLGQPLQFNIFTVAGVKCALAICADGGLLNLSDHLASLGVELLCNPAGAGGQREDRVVSEDLKTKAGREKYLRWLEYVFFPWPHEAISDCQRYCRGVAAVNQCGFDGRRLYHLGHGFIVNPMGEILAAAQGYPNLDRQQSAYLHAIMDAEDRLMPPEESFNMAEK